MTQLIDLHLALLDSATPVFRVLRVPSALRLDDLHAAIQIVMGWSGYHLHAFVVAGHEYGPRPDDDFEEQPEWAGEDRTLTLAEALARGDGRVEYHYQDWRLMLTVHAEEVAAAAPAIECVAGSGAAPADGSEGAPAFDLDRVRAELRAALRPRASAEFPAGPQASDTEHLLARVTLVALLLASRETRHGQREASKTMKADILDRLQDAGWIVTDPARKTALLTDAGAAQAAAWRDRLAQLL